MTSDLIMASSDNVIWETHKVALTRTPGYGFGIAVSGGKDNPHFANGDTAIAITDVLKGGPAQGKLQINDRVVSVNDISLQDVDHATAVSVLKDSGTIVYLVITRRIVLPASIENERPPLKITLTRRNRKDEYGVVLGCRYFVKEVMPNSVAAQEGVIKQGDTILRINNEPIENLSLAEAKKLLDKCKDKIQLIITKEAEDDGVSPASSTGAVRNGYFSDEEELRHQKTLGNYASVDDDVDIGFLRRHHEEQYVGKAKDIRIDPRVVKFQKDPESGLGLRLAGGNSTGIFIASVQPGSGAEAQGLTFGDQIIKVNDKDIVGLTREEAVTYLTSLEGMVTMVVQYRKKDFDQIMRSKEAGDSFYIRTHFNYEQQEVGVLSFVRGDIFHIKDTLYRGVVGSWLAVRIGLNNQETQKGIIPNRNRAEQLAISTQSSPEDDQEISPSKGWGLFAKRKTRRWSKSVSKEHWEEVVFSQLPTRFPAYEKVILKESGFVRPVVVFGPLADVARERILKDFPDKYQLPHKESHVDDEKKSRLGIIKLDAIKDVISQRKHCLLDITPQNVDRLNFSQLYPIVVNLKSDCKATVKELRSKWAKGSSKNARKLHLLNLKLEKYYQHLFTTTVTHDTSETWYKKFTDIVALQQQQQIWMSENKPGEDEKDDCLFPLSNHVGFNGNLKSDTGITHALDDIDMSLSHKKHLLVRSSSDPSLNTSQCVPGIPPYPDPPTYQQSLKILPGTTQNYQDVIFGDLYTGIQRFDDKYHLSYYADMADVDGHICADIDPYTTVTGGEGLKGCIPSDIQWIDGYAGNPPQSTHPSDDLYSKPLHHQQHISEAPPMSSPHQQHCMSELPSSPSPHEPILSLYNQQSLSQPSSPVSQNLQVQLQFSDNSSSSDSFAKYTSNPINKHDDSKLQEKQGQMGGNQPVLLGNDRYRFTRSTASKVSTSNVDRTKLSDLSAKFRNEPTDRVKLSNTNLGNFKQSQNPTAGTNDRCVLVEPSTSDQQTFRKQPPPVPVKTYNMKERGVEPDEQKVRNYENTHLRDYAYRESNPYSALPQGREPTKKYRSNSKDDQFPDLVVSSSEDPYEWLAPRQHSGNQNHNLENTKSEFRDGSPWKHKQYGHSFVNHMYIDHAELMRMRQERTSGVYNIPSRTRNGQGPTISHQGPVSALSDHQGFQAGSSFETYKPSPTPFDKLDSNSTQFDSDTQTLPRFDPTHQVDENHTVVATARGVFTSKGGVLESPETGVSIIIPPGSLPDHVEQEIYFKVCQDNSILPPLDREKGETLLSPLVMCGPHGLKFTEPVELRLPHHASVNPDSWSFALKSSDSPAGHPTQWHNMNLAEKEGPAQSRVGKTSVSVFVDHF